MKYGKIGLWIFLLILVIAILFLMSGATVLTRQVGPFYFGNVLTWVALIALPLSVLLGAKNIAGAKDSFLKLLKIALYMATFLGCSWGFIAYILSGNWSYNFNKNIKIGVTEASVYFWNFTYTLIIVTLLVLLLYAIHSYFRKNTPMK